MFSETKQGQWQVIGNVPYGDATPHTAPTKDQKTWAYFDANYLLHKDIPPKTNAYELRFRGAANAGTATVYIYAARPGANMAYVCTLTLTCGDQGVTFEGVSNHFIDTITLTQGWLKTVSIIDGSGTSGDGVTSSAMARIVFDLCGYAALGFVVTAENSTMATLYIDGAHF